MRQYNSSEATLEAWRRKLVTISGSEELLAIINNQQNAHLRLFQFKEKKNAILREFEAQEGIWTVFIT